MKRVGVLKFGGAAVATPERFHKIAQIINFEKKQYRQLVVVVSAMGGMTDHLQALAKQIHPNPPIRENDMLVSVGERISGALLAMALARIGIDAVSFTGSQAGIITSTFHGDADVVDVRPARVLKSLDSGKVVVVAGFQGVSSEKEITTLGRGGSDITAVALASALGSKGVVFFKDVDGIYSSDPKKDKKAEKIPFLNYEQAADLVSCGAKILHPRAIALAALKCVELEVRSFFYPEIKGSCVGKKLSRSV